MVVATEPGRVAPAPAEESAMSEPTRADGADPYEQTARFAVESGPPDVPAPGVPAGAPPFPTEWEPPGAQGQTRAFDSADNPAFGDDPESSPDYIPHTIAAPQ